MQSAEADVLRLYGSVRSVAKFVIYKFLLPSFRRIGLQYDTLDLTKQANFGPKIHMFLRNCGSSFAIFCLDAPCI